MIFNLTLIPIGNSYWVTATKIGSNYLKYFANSTDRYLRLSIGNVSENERIDSNFIYVTYQSGLKLKIQISDFDNINHTHLYTQNDVIDIFNKVTTLITRNPFERFKSGLVQKVSEFYTNLSTAVSENDLTNVKFHTDTYFDISKYPIDYLLLVNGFGKTPKDRNPKWQFEWDRFCNLFLRDVFEHPNIGEIFLEDLHTQPVYHFYYLILRDFENWNDIKTIDINELDKCSDLFINELGNDEYKRRYDLLHNRELWDGDDEQTTTLKRVSNKRLYFDSYLIREYFEKAHIYKFESIYYDILNKKRYNEKHNFKNII